MPIYVNIKKSFGEFSLDVEFEAESGVVGLLGASGCGKSLTLSCIAGLIRPDEGKIIVNGVTFFDSGGKIDLSPQRRRAGLLFQSCALFPNMTVEQNISCVLSKKRGVNAAERQGLLAGLIGKFYLGGLENHYPVQLSGGQKQRAALARIMAGEPSILMLDEPLSALDSYLRWQLEGELLQILEEFGGGGVALYVSHNRDEVYRLCDSVCVISAGRSEKIRTVEELFNFPDTLASALLSGCENYSRAEKSGAHSVRALDWGAELVCGADVSDGIDCVGVRARHISLSGETGKNGFICRVAQVAEDVLSGIVTLEPVNPPETSLSETGGCSFYRIRAELPKLSKKPKIGDVFFVEIDPSNVMLLKK